MKKRLYKSTKDKMVSGVCGGLAEYFGVDSTIIRLVWALLIASGSGLFLYLIMAIVVPDNPYGY